MILDQLIRAAVRRVAELPPAGGESVERDRHFSLLDALGRQEGQNAIIAEIKYASPSRGVIREDRDLPGLAASLASAGCAALSVLTEPHFFYGSPEYIPAVRSAVQVPVLRKDFIIDERQLAESRRLGADAVLLIAAVLGEGLPRMVDAANAYGLEPLVEVHTAAEADAVLETDTRMVGINNRDLATLRIDRSATRQLAPLLRGAGMAVISESGFSVPDDLREFRDMVDGFLIGSAIMAADEPASALEGFVFS
ncbi:MAG: indole-3-glycerol-phosphate synthase [Methanomicrobiaceae archaeon]|nr:indole-3-glycerol-phosphate synthase [Methanomicrobiaceae archaeon]